ncbi:MAG: TonB-dependent receptor [Steroidobacteraceae bacterium]
MQLRHSRGSVRAVPSFWLLASTALFPAGIPPVRAQSADPPQTVESLQTIKIEATRIITRTQAIRAKENAPNIIEVQPLEEMKKLPDVNLAEALQRVPGVSLETDSGEGRFVEIRGMDPDLDATDYDGVPLPASDTSGSVFGGNRAVALDTFPMGIVGGAEVVETNEPDMDAESLGGTVNLLPLSGAEHGGPPFVDVDVGGGWEPLRSSPVYNGSVTAGGSLDGGDGIDGLFAGPNALSAAVTAVYDDDQRGIDDVEEGYSDNQSSGVPDKYLNYMEFRWYKYHRRRYGVAANIDGKVNSANTLYLRLLYSGYLEQAAKHIMGLESLDSNAPCTPAPSCYYSPSNPSEFYTTGADVQQDTTDSLERIQNSLAILGGRSALPGATLDYKGWWVLGTDTVSRNFGSQWDDPNPVTLQYSYANPDWPTFQTLDGTNPADPATYTLTNIAGGESYDRDREFGGALDLAIPIGSHPADALKFGLMARLRHKTHLEHDPVWNPNATISLTPYVSGPPQVYYDGRYDIGPYISLADIEQLTGNTALTTYTDDAAADASLTVDDDENVYAGYGQYTGTFGKFGVLAGVRVEETRATYRGQIYNSDTDTNAPGVATNSYTNAFPTLQLRYQFIPKLVGRIAFSTAIARPGFNQITPGASVSVSGTSVTVGNPSLKPTLGDNLDLTLGYYPGHGQIAEVDFFGKKFTNFILLSQQLLPSYNFPGLVGIPTVVDSYSNGPAHVYGLEAQYQQQLLSLPAPFNGFGVNANTTIVHSEAQIHPGIHGPLPSTAELTWNLALFYQRGPLELRVATDYVGQNLYGYGPDLTNEFDDYSSPRLTLDFGSSYEITHSVQVYFDAKNLLNTPLKFTEGTSESRPIQREFYDITLLAGIRASL